MNRRGFLGLCASAMIATAGVTGLGKFAFTLAPDEPHFNLRDHYIDSMAKAMADAVDKDMLRWTQE